MSRPNAFGRNAVLVAAVLGWLFDGFEIGLFPLVGPRALDDLLAAELTAHPAVKDAWFGSIMAVFLVGAACGVEVEAFPRAGLWLSGIYLVGAALVWLIPETKGRPLPE